MNPNAWENIYAAYKNGGPAYATLQEEIEDDFKTLLVDNNFPIKKAFDVGYGTGNYLAFLRLKGFKIAGIDLSSTAYEMAVQTLGSAEGLICGDMFKYELPKESFDLIFANHVVHHGFKSDIKRLISDIHSSLVKDGWVFITLPPNSAANHWHSFKDKKQVTEGTFIPGSGPEKGLPHSFFSKDEVNHLFSEFSGLRIKETKGVFHITAIK